MKCSAMKRLIVGVALMALAGGATATEWRLIGKEVHLDDTTGAMVLSVSKGPDHKGLPVVVIKKTEDCVGVKHEEPMSGTPITIQSTRVRIIMMCTDSDDLVFFPETAAGRKILLDRIVSDKDVSMTMPDGATIRFKNRSGSEAVNRVFSLNDDPI